MTIKNKKFHDKVNKIILKIEKCLDKYQGKLDIDYESNREITKISFQSKNEIIITRQEFLKEIWIATKYRGYYFQYKKNKWFCVRNKCELFCFLKDYFSKKTKEKIFKKL